MLICQITDCHVVEPDKLLYGRVDTAAGLREAVAHIEAMVPRPDVVIATGDLVNAGRPSQYEHLASLLRPIDVPVYPVPGNHDDRTAMRACFDALAPGGPDDPIDYVIDDHEVRLIGLDTSIPGRHDGRLSPHQLTWLDEQLALAPETPTLLFLHHPPFRTGIDWMDASGLAGREALAAVVARHDQLGTIVCGHLHRPIQALVGGAVATTWPSTGAQVALALDGTPHQYVDERPAVALHLWHPEAGVVSHTSFVGSPRTWIPSWVTDNSLD